MPILGICYGVQLIAHLLGGKVERAEAREYGAARRSSSRRPRGSSSASRKRETLDVWMSHGDRIDAPCRRASRRSASPATRPFCVVGDADEEDLRRAVPPRGRAHAARQRDPRRRSSSTSRGSRRRGRPARSSTRRSRVVEGAVQADEHAVCGLSGGVDSSVAAVLCHRALGDRLTCIFVDNGLLRRASASRSSRRSARHFHLNLVAVDAREALPRRARRASPIPSRSARSSAASSSRSSRKRRRSSSDATLPRAGHALPGRHRERLVQGAERGHQEPPQRRRAARADEAQAHRAAARALQGRGARGRRDARHAARDRSGASRSPAPASRCAASAR